MASPSKSDDETTSLYASISFVIVVIVIGIPLWWKTTEVYRVPLPTSRVDDLLGAKFFHTIPVTIILSDRSVNKADLWEALNVEAAHVFQSDRLMYFNYQWTVREMVQEEEKIYNSVKSVKNFDSSLKEVPSQKGAKYGELEVFILPSESRITEGDVTIGAYRQIYLRNSKDFDFLLQQLFNSVKEYAVQASLLEKVFVPTKPRLRVKPEKEIMMPIGSIPVIDIVFSLIIAQPHFLNVSWDIQAAEIAYVTPIIKKLLPLTQVNIKSQILYMITLNTQSKLDAETKEHILPADQLPLIINPIESKLGMQVSSNPTLNFVTYVPPVTHMPLQIYDQKGVRVQSNSFLSPRWGSVLIQNFPQALNQSEGQEPLAVDINMQANMEAFIAHLCLLIGLPEKVSDSTVQILQNPEGNDLQLDFLLRRGVQEQLSSAISSLTSLIQLLNTINNIVITDEIGGKITTAVDAIEKSLEDLQYGRLYKAYVNSKQAFVSSEQAFFDPSLLAMLYFPNDQKYAVYIPLFLPVSLPVVMSFRQIFRYFSKRKTTKSDKVD